MRKVLATATASLLIAGGAASAQTGTSDQPAAGPFTIGIDTVSID